MEEGFIKIEKGIVVGKKKKRKHHQVCAVANCPNPRDASYHCFPKEPELREAWIQSCGKDKVNPKTARICGSHFLKDDFLRDLKNELLGLPLVKRLKPGSVPTLNLSLPKHHNHHQQGKKKVINASPRVVLRRIDEVKQPMIKSERLPSPPLVAPATAVNLHHDYSMSAAMRNGGIIANAVINEVNNVKTLQKLKAMQDKFIAEKKRHRLEIMSLKKELKHLKSKSYVDNLIQKTLLKTQTPAQVTKILKPDTPVRGYTKKDITFALALQSISNKSYKFIDSKNLLALPSNRTLERWIKTTNCPPGLQEDGIQRVKDILENAEYEFDKYAVVSVNEMILKKKCEYDTLTKNIFGPHSKVQTVIVSGLVKDFSQPVYYEFDTNINKNLFLDIVQYLEQHEIMVVAATISLRNHKLISELGVNSAVHSFVNPYDHSRIIFAFSDTLHMMRLLRNHVIDDGFQIPDGNAGFVPLTKEDFQNIIRHDSVVSSTHEKLHPKLTDLHINCKGSVRKKIILAVQLLSETSAKAIAKIFSEPESVKAKAVYVINNWFDVMNSSKVLDTKKLSCGFGIQLMDQLHALDEMERLVSNMLIGVDSKITRLPFQDSIVMSIRSTKDLYSFLKQKGCEFLLTSKVNHAPFDAFASSVRDICSDGNFPSALKVVMHLRILNISQNEDDTTLKKAGGYSHVQTSRVEEEEEEQEPKDYPEELLEEEYNEEEDVDQWQLTESDGKIEIEHHIAHEETIVPEIAAVIEKETEEEIISTGEEYSFFEINTISAE